MLEFLAQNWQWLAALVVIAFGLIWTAVKRPKQIQEWLILACAKAEAALGSGTGKLKLREVYDAFISKYPVISIFIPFATFQKWTEAALTELKSWIADNPKVAEFLGATDKDEEEV